MYKNVAHMCKLMQRPTGNNNYQTMMKGTKHTDCGRPPPLTTEAYVSPRYQWPDLLLPGINYCLLLNISLP